MESSVTQFMFALPVVVLGGWVGIRALVWPRTASVLGLSFAVFSVQFCLGPLLGFLQWGKVIPARDADVVLAFLGVYAFWIGAALLALVWKSPLPVRQFPRLKGGVESVRGLFSNLTHAAVRIGMPALVAMYAAILAARLFMLVKYDVVLSGTVGKREWLTIPYHVLVIYRIFENLGLAFVYVAVTKIARSARVFESPALIVMVLLELTFALTQGRRYILMLLLFGLFAVLVLRGGIRAKHALVGVLGFGLLWWVVFPFFFFMRDEWKYRPRASVLTWVANAAERTLTGPDVLGREGESYVTNVADRLNAMVFNCNVARSLNAGVPPLSGQILRNTTISAIPRVFYPAKLLYAREADSLVNEQLHVPGKDQVSNLPAFGLAEFGVAGCALYGVLFTAAVRMVEMILRWLFTRSPLLSVAAVSNLVTVCVFTMEFTPESFLEMMRLVLMVFVVSIAWTLVYRPRQQPAPVAGGAVVTGPTPGTVAGVGPGARGRRLR